MTLYKTTWRMRRPWTYLSGTLLVLMFLLGVGVLVSSIEEVMYIDIKSGRVRRTVELHGVVLSAREDDTLFSASLHFDWVSAPEWHPEHSRFLFGRRTTQYRLGGTSRHLDGLVDLWLTCDVPYEHRATMGRAVLDILKDNATFLILVDGCNIEVYDDSGSPQIGWTPLGLVSRR